MIKLQQATNFVSGGRFFSGQISGGTLVMSFVLIYLGEMVRHGSTFRFLVGEVFGGEGEIHLNSITANFEYVKWSKRKKRVRKSMISRRRFYEYKNY